MPKTITYDAVSPALCYRAAKAACKFQGSRGIRNTLQLVLAWFALVFFISQILRFEAVQNGGVAFIVGLAVMWIGLIIIGRIQRSGMNRILANEQARRGTTQMTARAEGCVFSSSFGETSLNWSAIDETVDLGTGTGLQTGLMVYPLPNDGLAPELESDQFRRQLAQWRETAVA